MARRIDLQGALRRALTEDIGFKLLSLLFAVVLWGWVQSGQVVDARTRAQVEYRWPDGLVGAREVPKTLVVTVSGPQGVVRRIQRGSLSVVADLSESEKGNVSVDFSQLEVGGLPQGVEVVQLSPPAIDVELDKAMTKEVQVQPTVIGEPAPGWAIASIEVTPESVHILGPQVKVRALAQVSTDVIDVSGVREDKVVDAALSIPDPVVDAAPGSPRRVKVAVRVEPVIVERTFEDVPVMVRGPGWRVEPSAARVTLRGPQEAIGGIQMDRVAVVLDSPGNGDGDGRVDLTWRSEETEGIRVTHDGPADQVEVARVDPRRFRLVEGQ